MNNLKIRIATLADASKLLDIYAYYVQNTAITFEYEVPPLEEFEGRMRGILDKYPYIVAEREGQVLGYAYAGPFKGRPAYQWCVETSIHVQKDCRQEGIGKALYLSLEEILKSQNFQNLYACIAYPAVEDEYLTKNSVYFHEKLGYRLVGEFYRCGYKHHRWYNMVWMEKMIGEHPEAPDPIIAFPERNA